MFVVVHKNNFLVNINNLFSKHQITTITMAFGRYQNKWRLLAENLAYSLEKNTKILHVCAILHNFVIDNDSSENEDYNDREDAILP